MVDCDNCKNSGTHCNECEHYWDLTDCYNPMTAAEIAEKQEKMKQDFFLSIPSDLIAVELTEATIESFKVAKEYTRVDPGKYNWLPSVYFGVNCLVATDQYRLIEIKEVEVPEHLVGKHVLEIDEQRGIARVMREPGANPLSSNSYQEVIDAKLFTVIPTTVGKVQESTTPSPILDNNKNNLIKLAPPIDTSYSEPSGIKIYLNKDKIATALGHFGDADNEIEFMYSNPTSPVIFKNSTITAVLLPVRINKPIRY